MVRYCVQSKTTKGKDCEERDGKKKLTFIPGCPGGPGGQTQGSGVGSARSEHCNNQA